jgi:hypothetical protein
METGQNKRKDRVTWKQGEVKKDRVTRKQDKIKEKTG